MNKDSSKDFIELNPDDVVRVNEDHPVRSDRPSQADSQQPADEPPPARSKSAVFDLPKAEQPRPKEPPPSPKPKSLDLPKAEEPETPAASKPKNKKPFRKRATDFQRRKGSEGHSSTNGASVPRDAFSSPASSEESCLAARATIASPPPASTIEEPYPIAAFIPAATAVSSGKFSITCSTAVDTTATAVSGIAQITALNN